ncbi:hypothetical protein ACTRLV_05520 [Corynebacterium durum]|nr:hypothetical protein [Corynebacterium durum]NYI73185.1 hypothetical protein [Corynebacterium durum]
MSELDNLNVMHAEIISKGILVCARQPAKDDVFYSLAFVATT